MNSYIILCIAALALYPVRFAHAADTPAMPESAEEDAVPYSRNALALIENEMRVWGQRPIILNALREQNTRTDDMTLSEVKSLNDLWRSELKKTHKNMITRVLTSPLSDYVKAVREQSKGLYTEIIIIDAQGLAVAMTQMNESYSYVDQPFWKKTVGMNSVLPYIGEVVFSDNTMLFQAAAALPLTEDERIIGVVFAGIDTEILDERY